MAAYRSNYSKLAEISGSLEYQAEKAGIVVKPVGYMRNESELIDHILLVTRAISHGWKSV